jgi:limonene-1,2-epoxide hydrolase
LCPVTICPLTQNNDGEVPCLAMADKPCSLRAAFVGRAQMRANWEAMFAGIPDFHAEICRSVQDGDTTWTEWRWAGTRSDGQIFEVRGVTLFEITDDQIVAGRLYLEDAEPDVAGIGQAVEAPFGPSAATGAGIERRSAPLTTDRVAERASSPAHTCRDEAGRATAMLRSKPRSASLHVQLATMCSVPAPAAVDAPAHPGPTPIAERGQHSSSRRAQSRRSGRPSALI